MICLQCLVVVTPSGPESVSMVAVGDVKKLKVQVSHWTVTRSEALAYACDPFPDLQQLRGQELKDELQSRGLDTSGLKAALVERLEDALADAPAASDGAAAAPGAEAPTDAAANGADAKPAEGEAADGKV